MAEVLAIMNEKGGVGYGKSNFIALVLGFISSMFLGIIIIGIVVGLVGVLMLLCLIPLGIGIK